MKRQLAALGSGLLFAIGLGISGMTRPGKIIAFLDVTGHWDPSLLVVMAGAVAIYAATYWSSRRMQKPLANDAFSAPAASRPDARLIIGAAVFGIGWGLSGFCPGPAIASAGAGVPQALLFVGSMLGGMWLTRALLRRVDA